MAASEAQIRASKKYQQKFDRLQIRISRKDKDRIDIHAEKMGESVNSFVRRAITETMERDLSSKEKK